MEGETEYRMTHRDEIFGYMRVDPRKSGLRVTLFVDDTKAYQMYNHPPLLFARNGYGKTSNGFIPFMISPNPVIMDKEIDIRINYNDVYAIQNFIKRPQEDPFLTLSGGG